MERRSFLSAALGGVAALIGLGGKVRAEPIVFPKSPEGFGEVAWPKCGDEKTPATKRPEVEMWEASAEEMRKAFCMGAVTCNEYRREVLGLPPIPNGDHLSGPSLLFDNEKRVRFAKLYEFASRRGFSPVEVNQMTVEQLSDLADRTRLC